MPLATKQASGSRKMLFALPGAEAGIQLTVPSIFSHSSAELHGSSSRLGRAHNVLPFHPAAAETFIPLHQPWFLQQESFSMIRIPWPKSVIPIVQLHNSRSGVSASLEALNPFSPCSPSLRASSVRVHFSRTSTSSLDFASTGPSNTKNNAQVVVLVIFKQA